MTPEDARMMLFFWWKPYQWELDEAQRIQWRALPALALLAAAAWVAIHSPLPFDRDAAAVPVMPWLLGLVTCVTFGLWSLVNVALGALSRRYEMLAPLDCWWPVFRDGAAIEEVLRRMGETEKKNADLNERRRRHLAWATKEALVALLGAGLMALVSWMGG